MLHKYWDASIKATSDSFSAILRGEAAHTWQQLRAHNDGMTNSALIHHVLNVTARSVQAHLRGIGPYLSVPTIFAGQQDVFDLIDWPRRKTPIPSDKWRKLEEPVGTVIGGVSAHHLKIVRYAVLKRDPSYILGEAARLTLRADRAEAEAEGDPTKPGYYVMDPFRHRPTSLYEILGIGRWAKTGKPEQRKGMEP